MKLGRFEIIGEHAPAPDGPYIRVVPFQPDNQFFPWWSVDTREMLEALPDLSGLSVCDFGCGAVAILAIAAARLGAEEVVAIENVPSIAEQARRQIAANGLDIPVLSELPAGAKYDFLMANLGNAAEVGRLSKRALQGIGTSAEGDLLRW